MFIIVVRKIVSFNFSEKNGQKVDVKIEMMELHCGLPEIKTTNDGNSPQKRSLIAKRG